jgi:N-acetylmuramoyl-L-alanine amidase
VRAPVAIALAVAFSVTATSPGGDGGGGVFITVPSAHAEPKILDRPIRYDAERIALTKLYRERHQGDVPADIVSITPKLIVLHYTAGSSLEGTWNYFNRNKMEQARAKLASAGDLNVSAHFLIDRDGTIVRLMPETSMARHTIGLNHLAIGVENVGDGRKYPLTPAQVEANAWLIRDLAKRFPITHVIGHLESERMRKHPYWRELDPKYGNRKPDPGAAFMTAVRAEIADLGLAGPP